VLTANDALIIPLSCDAMPTFRTLVDSGSEDCFIDVAFAKHYRLPRKCLQNPLRLRLFDGSLRGLITHSVALSVRFPSGQQMIIDFLLTTLDPTCSAVLGHRWLHRYNPRIDWFHGSITFNTQISPTVTHDFAPGFLADDPDSPDASGTPQLELSVPASVPLDDTALQAAAANIDI